MKLVQFLPQCWFSIASIFDVVVGSGAVTYGVIASPVDVLCGQREQSPVSHAFQHAGIVLASGI